MFSSSASGFLRVAMRHAPAFANPRSWSIRLRFAVLYSASSILIILVVSAVMYVALEQKLALRDHAALVERVEALRELVRERTRDDAETWRHKWEERTARAFRSQVRIVDPQGQVAAQTPDMVIPARAFPDPAAAGDKVGQSRRFDVLPKEHPRLMAAWADDATPQRGRWLIQVALDLAESERILDTYREQLVTILIVAVLVVALASVFVARTALRPLAQITRSVQLVTAGDLNRRLQSASWPAELSQLAAAIDDMLQRLDKSFARLTQFSSDIAHELRTPINNLIGETGVTLTRARTDDEYRQVLESNLEEYQRLSRMIESMLFIARAVHAEIVLRRSALQAREHLVAICAFFDALAKDCGVRIRSCGDAVLSADPDLLRRALTNLVSNALHHSPPGGEVWLVAKPTSQGGAVIEVRDKGIGIAPDQLDRLFDRFYRVDSARGRNMGGAGLGLAIVKSIMTLHGGSVRVDSRVNEGSVFTLVFPPAHAAVG